MKHKKWTNNLLGAVFAFGLSISVVECIITGFDLTIAHAGSLILGCGVFSLTSALLFRFKYGGAVLLSLSVLTALILYHQSDLRNQFQFLLQEITTQYHLVYSWPVLGSAAAEAVDLPLMLLGWWTAASVSCCICHYKSVLTALPSVIMPLVLCLITTHTVPGEAYLFLLILGVALLLLTDWVRRNHPPQSVLLTARMSLPIATALAVLFLMNPQEAYINNAAQLQKNIVTWFQSMQARSEDLLSGEGTDVAGGQRLNLRTVGPKSNLSYSVMRVTSTVNGTLYLRGQDYDIYKGTGWESSADRSETFTSGKTSSEKLSVVTYGVRNIMYVPYYAAETITLTNGSVKNNGNLQEYSFDLDISPADSACSYDQRTTQLPSDTFSWASALAEEITSECRTRNDKIQAIGNYVRNSAAYDLSTSRMSADYNDFALWFLEESDTGYCVHFATATTVLLRAAGIPARYVEGYMVSCRSGERVIVSNQSAHAWTEYYDSDTSAWRVLEATPADEDGELETYPSLPTDSTETEPQETQTQITQPTENEESLPSLAPGDTELTTQDRSFNPPGWMGILLLVVFALAVIVLQGEARILLKRKRWSQGAPNEKALYRWKYLQRLARILHCPLPEELEELAQKACFSQHILTREELKNFEYFRRDSMQTIRSLPLLRKWLLRWILAIG